MRAFLACLQNWRQRIRQRPARHLRMVLASLLLAYILYESIKYSHYEESNADVPDMADINPRSQRLRLRIRASSIPKAKERAALPQSESQIRPFTAAQKDSIAQPLRIAIMTAHYFGESYARQIDNCSMEGIPLDCSFFRPESAPDFGQRVSEIRSADALWWHGPSTCLLPGGPWERKESDNFSLFKVRAEQWAVIASMESSAYYKCLEDEDFLENFDIKMTYHRTAEVPLLYWNEGYRGMWERKDLLPGSERKDAVAFINSNCDTPSGRTQIVNGLSRMPNITIDALGKCMSTGPSILRGAEAKREAFEKYRYCIAIENSIAKDYVTEKVYDALAAGCVPIYLGAPNINEFIPSMDAIIDYNAFGSVEALAGELQRLSHNESAYMEKLKWREHPELWGKEFKLIQNLAAKKTHTQCQLCQVIAKDRAGITNPSSGRLLRRTNLTTGGNQTWMNTSKYHVKNVKIQYRLADAQVG